MFALALIASAVLSACSPSLGRGGSEALPRTLLPTLVVSPPATGPAPGDAPPVATTPDRFALPRPTPQLPPVEPPQPLAGIEISSPGIADSLRLVAESGAYWTKKNGLIWSVVESTEGLYNWGAVTSLEAELAEASERGLEMVLVVRGTPSWAQAIPEYHCGPILKEKLPAFGEFLHEAVRRYSAPPFNVRYWEIWNEPDAGWRRSSGDAIYGCWGEADDPYYGGGAYAEMLKAVYPRIKEADPNAQVLVGGLLLDCDPGDPPDDPPGSGILKDCLPARFFEGILQAGGGDFFDGVGFHAYDYYGGSLGNYANPNWGSSWDTTGPVLAAKQQFLSQLLDAYGHPDKYLMNTELALLCGQTGGENVCRDDDYADSKAYYLAQAYAAAQAAGLHANIWFSLTGWRASELIVRGSLRPNSAYEAFAASASFLDGAATLGRVDAYPGVAGFRFENDEAEIWILWSSDGLSHPIDLPRMPKGLYDVIGEPLPIGLELDVTLAPVWAVFPSD